MPRKARNALINRKASALNRMNMIPVLLLVSMIIWMGTSNTMQNAAMITSRLELLSLLANASELSAFGRHLNGIRKLNDCLKAALNSLQHQPKLQLKHNLLQQLSAAVSKALQLIAQGTGVAEASDETLCSISLLCLRTSEWLVHTRQHSSGTSGTDAVPGEWHLQDCAAHECFVLISTHEPHMY